MRNYGKNQDAAQRMIRKSGFPVLLRRAGEYDFNADTTPDGQEWGGYAVMEGSLSSAATRSMSSFSDGSLVTSKSKSLLLVIDDKKDAQNRTFCPAQGDVVQMQGAEWKISAVDTLEPGGVPVMHTVVLEGVCDGGV